MAKKVYQQRILKLQHQLKPKEAWLITNQADITYFSGYHTFLLPQEREGVLVLTKTKAILMTPPMISLQKFDFIQYQVGCKPQQLAKHLAQLNKQTPISVLKVDFDQLTLTEKEAILSKNITFKIKNINKKIIWKMRLIKDNEEIKLLKKSAKIAATTIAKITQNLKPGQTEIEVANLIDYQLTKAYAKPAFPTIVAFGPGSALPHYQPQKVKLKPETPVLIDMGASYQGYKSDLTRTFWFGKHPDKIFQDRYRLVQKAYHMTLKNLTQAVKKSQVITAKDLDQVARETIAQAGLADKFIHTTGHGLGLSIHEPPSLSFKDNTVIKPSMTLTIEPGIYFSGEFGIRLENTFLIEDKKVVTLTNSTHTNH